MRSVRPLRRRAIALATSTAAALGAAGVLGGPAHAAPATTTFDAVADSYVQASNAFANTGAKTKLSVDNEPVRVSYVRFDVNGLAGPVTRATLRLTTLSSHNRGFEVRAVADDTWGELTINHNNAPPYSQSVTAQSLGFTTGQTLTLDVTPLVTTNELVSLALTTPSLSTISLASREHGSAPAPALIVETGDAGPEVAPANVAPPTISGTPRDGQTLTAERGDWTGSAPIAYAYQWRRCDAQGLACTDIPGATATTHRLTSGDVGSTVRVHVAASNTAGSAGSESAQTAPVEAQSPANTIAPSITGPAREAQALTASPGTWTGTAPIGYAYRWRRCAASGEACADIGGATAQTYTLEAADVGATVRVLVTASNSGGSGDATSAPSQIVQAADAPVEHPVIAAAGDIACDPASSSFNGGAGTSSACRQKAVSDLLVGTNLSAVLALGDTQYECGGLAAFMASYEPSWGRARSITRPAIGNHEYTASGGSDCDATGSARGYFDYFGAAAGDPTKGYYSFDIGSWHLVALNSNCTEVGGCGAGSPQNTWLREDLAASSAPCTLGFWHHPRFSSGKYRPGTTTVAPLFQALYDHGADLALAGHDHLYERFAPQDPTGALDMAAGVRQFTVGTGGKSRYAFTGAIANSEWRDGANYGVLRLTLRDDGYDWRFVSESGVALDSGSDFCEGTAVDTTAPTAPTNLRATPTTSSVDLAWGASADDRGVVGYDVYRDGALLARVAASPTSYTDATVTANTSYEYVVRARDAAGNVSAPSDAATASTGSTTLQTFVAIADSRVAESSPNSNYGSSYLRTDGAADPDVESYLRFAVGGTSGTVRSAKLRLWARSGSADGPMVYAAPGSWTESAITWNTRPARVGSVIADAAKVTASTWIELDVTSLVTGDGTYEIALIPTSTDGVDLSSREDATGRPELVVVTG